MRCTRRSSRDLGLKLDSPRPADRHHGARRRGQADRDRQRCGGDRRLHRPDLAGGCRGLGRVMARLTKLAGALGGYLGQTPPSPRPRPKTSRTKLALGHVRPRAPQARQEGHAGADPHPDHERRRSRPRISSRATRSRACWPSTPPSASSRARARPTPCSTCSTASPALSASMAWAGSICPWAAWALWPTRWPRRRCAPASRSAPMPRSSTS